MNNRHHHDSSEDMFAETRMTFGEHLEELRVHLLRAIYGFMIALAFSLAFLGKPALRIISEPVTKQLEAFYQAHAQKVIEELPSNPDLQRINRRRFVEFSVPLSFLEAFQGRDDQPAFPADAQPAAFGDLVERAYRDIAFADVALARNQWDRLPALAADLDKIATRLPAATDPPEGFGKTRMEILAKEISSKAGVLGRAADGRDRPGAKEALRTLGRVVPFEEIREDQLLPLRISMEAPLLFSGAINDALNQISARFGLAALSIQEGIMAWFKVSMVCGLVVGCPWIFYQIWLFVAAGLYPHEKRLVNVYLPVSVGLFLTGVIICQVFVIPKAIEALLWFDEWVGMKPDLRFNEWLGFAIMMPVVFGISFQLPLVMMFMERIGILTVQMYKDHWKIAFFLIHVFAALITPSVDFISMELLALPMFGLYGLGILLCKLRPHDPSDLDLEVPDSEEPVGV